MIDHHERDLNDGERQDLAAQVQQLRAAQRMAVPKTAAAALIVCGPLAVLTLRASDSAAAVIVAFWAVVASGLTLWIVHGTRRAIGSRISDISSALSGGRARALRVVASRVVEFEEIEDEGAGFAFQVDAQRILFLHGQQYYPNDTFPSTDFEVVEFLSSDRRPIGEQIVNRGVRLTPERIIGAATKDALVDWRPAGTPHVRDAWPDDRSILEGDVSRLEDIIRARAARPPTSASSAS
jgi:hypothetical protein